MATVSEIINFGFREANTTAIGFTPSADEQTEGLQMLQGIVNSVFAMVVGTKTQSWMIPTPQKNATRAARYPALLDSSTLVAYDVTLPPANARLVMKTMTPMTVFFQYEPNDGALMEYVDVGHQATVTLDANGALFGLVDFTSQVVIPARYPDSRNAPRRWVYRADYGSWVEITTLGLIDTMPFPDALDDYWITSLAIRLSARYGEDPRASTMLRNKTMTDFMRLQYLQDRPVITGDVGGNAYQSYRSRLDQGSPYTGSTY